MSMTYSPAARTGSRTPSGLLRPLGRQARQLLLPTGTTVAILLAWEIVVRAYAVPVSLMPAPSVIFARLMESRGAILAHTIPTATETVLSFLLATVLGIVLAIALTYSRTLKSAVYPGVVLFQLIPKVALAPLFVVWFGIGSESRLAFGVFIAFFPIVIATMAGLRDTPPDMLRLCRVLTATNWQMFMSVRMPYAVPHIFSGMKISVTFAIIGVIVAEFITAQRGLGYLIVVASSQADTPLILAAIFALCVVGLLLYGAVGLAEKIAARFYGAS